MNKESFSHTGFSYNIEPLYSSCCAEKLNEKKKPKIFKAKKIKLKNQIPLNTLGGFFGIVKYFPPQNVEWVNSIYSYNSNYNKLLTIADKNLMFLAKSYLNIKFRRKQKERKLIRAKRLGITLPLYRIYRRRINLKRRLSLNRVFIANGGIKHTSTQATITLFFYKKAKNYIKYNTMLKLFKMNFKRIQRTVRPFPLRRKTLPKLAIIAERKLISYKMAQVDIINRNRRKKTIFELTRKLDKYSEKESKYRTRRLHRKIFIKRKNLKNFWKSIVKSATLFNGKESIITYWRYFSEMKARYRFFLPSSPTGKGHKKKDRFSFFLEIFENRFNYYKNKGSDMAIFRLQSRKYRSRIVRYNNFLKFFFANELKFKKIFLENFQMLSSKIYNKNVLFNFVKLKRIFYNSNIYSQMLAIRLKKREYGLSTLLTRSFAKLNIPKVPQKLRLKVVKQNNLIARNKLYLNNMSNLNILDLFSSVIVTRRKKKLWFRFLLLKFNNVINPFSLFGRILFNHRKNQNLRSRLENVSTVRFSTRQLRKIINRFNFKAKFIKNKILAGIRVEISGRLTRRFKAARAVYKLKWRGGSRNLQASIFRLPVCLIRGHVLSNIEYTVFSGLRRIGAYGVKTTVSSRDTRYYSNGNINNNGK